MIVFMKYVCVLKYLNALDNDFAFLAECNIGGEFMADEKLERLSRIAQYT